MSASRARRGSRGSKTNRPRYVQWGVCPSGKRAHPDRASAKQHAARLRQLGTHVRPYRCSDCGYWHVGHLPRVVAVGLVTAAAHYAVEAGR